MTRALCSPARPSSMAEILYVQFIYEDGFKINIFRQYPRYYTCPLKPSAGLHNLMRLSL
jgi:hypothetical protein